MAYVDMRNVGNDGRSNDRRITATTRQLESMIRLSEAHARMRYSYHVEVRLSITEHAVGSLVIFALRPHRSRT